MRKRSITDDYRVVTDMTTLDVMLEATGVPEIGARAALRSIRARQALAMMNVEADITVGRILNWYAAQKGVLYALAYQVYKDVYPTLIALQRKITE